MGNIKRGKYRKKVKDNKNIIYLVDENCMGNCMLVKENEFIAPGFNQIEMMTLDFEFIQQPVTFEEVLNSDKKCRVEHEMFKDACFRIKPSDSLTIIQHKESIFNNQYMFIKDIMYVLGYVCTEDSLKKIIKEGKWYLEP